MSERFDPRKHSVVAITIRDKQPCFSGSRGEEVPMKSYVIGPSAPNPGLSLHRAATAPLRSCGHVQRDGSLDATPRVLNQNGKWVQHELPHTIIAESQAQPLTATSTLTSTLPGSGAQRSFRPVTAIYTYNDISPVCCADVVHDSDIGSTMIKESTYAEPRPALSGTLRASQARAQAPTVAKLTARKAWDATTTVTPSDDARANSIDSFWSRQAGAAFNLGIPDLDRVQDLGRNVAIGACNTRLIGGRWRYLERPVDGDVVYTDYYGRCGTKLNDYYGRAYHVSASHFKKNSLVGDADYTKTKASMQGIQSLRARPGLMMDTTIVNGPQEKLQGMKASEAKTMRGVHKLHEFARMSPATERELRAVWSTGTCTE